MLWDLQVLVARINVNDIKDKNSLYTLKTLNLKTEIHGRFITDGEKVEIYRRYLSLVDISHEYEMENIRIVRCLKRTLATSLPYAGCDFWSYASWRLEIINSGRTIT